MKSPRGFGKNYFSLSSILAYSVESSLKSQVHNAHNLMKKALHVEDECDVDDPPDEILDTLQVISKKPCHCNRFFKIRIRLILLCNHFIPRCPFYTVCFAYRRSGVHPPYTI